MLSGRLTHLYSFIIICVLLLISVWLQFFKGVQPCPLCTLQRLSFVLLSILFLLGALFYRYRLSRLVISSFAMVIALLGLVLAGRQVWLQHFPVADDNQCGASLQYMLSIMPWDQMVTKIFSGSAECTQRTWEFLSLSMAEWSLLWFGLFLLLTIYLLYKESKP